MLLAAAAAVDAAGMSNRNPLPAAFSMTIRELRGLSWFLEVSKLPLYSSDIQFFYRNSS